jgi:putative restriction endonuclease
LLSLAEIADIVPPSLIDAQASGNSVPEEIVPILERRLAPWLKPLAPPIESDQADDPAFDPESIGDERLRAFRAIRIRRGQVAFRSALLEAYAGRCAITGCAIVDVLEAAHILPHMGPQTNHVTNGLLLRTDIHTLFDCGLLAIHPETRHVVIAKILNSSSYSKIADKPLRLATSELARPSKEALQRRFKAFEVRNG